MTKKQLLKAFLLVALLLAAISTYFAQGGKRQPDRTSSSAAAPLTESVREQMIEEQLKNLLAPVGVTVPDDLAPSQGSSHQTLLLHLQPADKSAASDTRTAQQQSSHTVSVLKRISHAGSMPHLRTLELSEDQVLVVGVGANEAMRWWTLIQDPRLRRVELPGPSGELKGETAVLTETDFGIAYPADASMTELRFYHPRWTGTDFVLEPIGSVSLQ